MLLRLQPVERLENTRGTVPFHFHTGSRDVFAILRRDRNKRTRLQPEFLKKFPILLLNLAKSFFGVIHKVHFVYDHDQILDTEHAQQISVPAALFADAFVCADYEYGCVRPRRAGDHIF